MRGRWVESDASRAEDDRICSRLLELLAVTAVGEERNLTRARRLQRGDLGDANVGVAEDLAAEALDDLGEPVSLAGAVHRGNLLCTFRKLRRTRMRA